MTNNGHTERARSEETNQKVWHLRKHTWAAFRNYDVYNSSSCQYVLYFPQAMFYPGGFWFESQRTPCGISRFSKASIAYAGFVAQHKWLGHLQNHVSRQNSLSNKLNKAWYQTHFILGAMYFPPRITGKQAYLICLYSYSSLYSYTLKLLLNSSVCTSTHITGLLKWHCMTHDRWSHVVRFCGMLKIPTIWRDKCRLNSRTFLAKFLPTSPLRISAGYSHRTLVGKSGMIKTQTGEHNRSVIAAEYGTPWAIQSRSKQQQ
jgi:hypothetical protein